MQSGMSSFNFSTNRNANKTARNAFWSTIQDEERPDHIRGSIEVEDQSDNNNHNYLKRQVVELPKQHRPSRLMSRTIELPEVRPPRK